jgi:hypothetical protein
MNLMQNSRLRMALGLFLWVWVAGVFAAYVLQFRSLYSSILSLLGLDI